MTTNRVKLFVYLVAAVALLSGSMAYADVLTPVAATASTFYSETYDGVTYASGPDLTIDGSGMTMSGDVSTWTAQGTASGTDLWMSDGTTVAGQWLKYDLGSTPATLNNIYMWQYCQVARPGLPNEADLRTRGIKDFTVWGSDSENGTYTQISGALQMSEATTINGAEPTQSFALNGSCYRWVQVQIGSNWGDASYVGVNEVRFNATPEPGTLILLMTGLLGLLAYAWKKRK